MSRYCSFKELKSVKVFATVQLPTDYKAGHLCFAILHCITPSSLAATISWREGNLNVKRICKKKKQPSLAMTTFGF